MTTKVFPLTSTHKNPPIPSPRTLSQCCCLLEQMGKFPVPPRPPFLVGKCWFIKINTFCRNVLILTKLSLEPRQQVSCQLSCLPACVPVHLGPSVAQGFLRSQALQQPTEWELANKGSQASHWVGSWTVKLPNSWDLGSPESLLPRR